MERGKTFFTLLFHLNPVAKEERQHSRFCVRVDLATNNNTQLLENSF